MHSFLPFAEIDVSKSAAESDYSTSVTRPGRASFEHNYDPPAPEPEFTAVASKSKKGNKSRENVTKLVFGGSHGSSTTNYYMVPGPEPKAAPTSMGGISLSNAPAMATPTHSVYAQQQLQQVPVRFSQTLHTGLPGFEFASLDASRTSEEKTGRRRTPSCAQTCNTEKGLLEMPVTERMLIPCDAIGDTDHDSPCT